MANPNISDFFSEGLAANVSEQVLSLSSVTMGEGDYMTLHVALDGNQLVSGITAHLRDSGGSNIGSLTHKDSDVADETTNGVVSMVVFAIPSLSAAQVANAVDIYIDWFDSNEKGAAIVTITPSANHDGEDGTTNVVDNGFVQNSPVPALTTTVDNSLILSALAMDGGGLIQHPSGFTELVEVAASGGGLVTLSLAYLTQASTGAISTPTWETQDGVGTGTAKTNCTSVMAIKAVVAEEGGGGGSSSSEDPEQLEGNYTYSAFAALI